MTTFGEYSLERCRFNNYRKQKEGLFQYSVTQIDRKRFSDEEIGDFLRSYINDMGKWENILNIKEDLINVGNELLKGFNIPVPYAPQDIIKYEEVYSIYNIEEKSPDCKIVEIKVSYKEEIEEHYFELRMKNVDKWRLLKNSTDELKELIKLLDI